MNIFATPLKALGAAVLVTAAASSFAAADTYNVDPGHTFARFEYSHFGYSNQQSRFDTTSGKVVLDRAAKKAEVDITIDAKSVSTGSTAFNGHIQGEDFFDTAKFPTITFKSKKAEFKGDKLESVSGDLTIKGVTKPVTLSVSNFHCMPHPMAKKEACGANATTKVKRSDFNMGKYTPYVGDEVSISIAIESFKE